MNAQEAYDAEMLAAENTRHAALSAAHAAFVAARSTAADIRDAAIDKAVDLPDETVRDAARRFAEVEHFTACKRASREYQETCNAATAAFVAAEESAAATFNAVGNAETDQDGTAHSSTVIVAAINLIDERIKHHQSMVHELQIERGAEVRRLVGNRHGGMARAARALGVSQTHVTRILSDDVIRRVGKVLVDGKIASWCKVTSGKGTTASVVLNTRNRDDVPLSADVRAARAEVVLQHLSEAGLLVGFGEPPAPGMGQCGVLAGGGNLLVRVLPAMG
jgi:hypothetical protein